MSEFIEFDTEMTAKDAMIIVDIIDRMHDQHALSHVDAYDAQLDYIYTLNL